MNEDALTESSRRGSGGLPDRFLRLVDGLRLPEKIGHTFLLLVTDEERWPHLAMLSVGEVYGRAPHRVYIALHGGSRTSQALRRHGRALMFTVIDGQALKIRLMIDVARETTSDDSRVYFVGEVREVTADAVPYATVVDGVRYQLSDSPAVMDRWEATIETLRRLSQRPSESGTAP